MAEIRKQDLPHYGPPPEEDPASNVQGYNTLLAPEEQLRSSGAPPSPPGEVILDDLIQEGLHKEKQDLENLNTRKPKNRHKGKKSSKKTIDPMKEMEQFEVSQEYVNKLGKEEFLYQNLIIKNHVLTIIAMPGGAKTTFMFYVVAPALAQAGKTVWYMDADSPASDHKVMKQVADQHGFKFINPDVNQGTTVDSFLATLREIADSHADLTGWVLIIDTLKKVADLMSKASVKECYRLARKLTTLGATVVLLGHANKFRDKENNLVFEGTGDVRADTDELIYFERITNPKWWT